MTEFNAATRSSRPNLSSTATSPSSTSTTTASPQQPSMKQRRVSLPGASPMQSISARLDRLASGDASPFNEKAGQSSMGPPLTGAASSWAVSFRDDSGLPSLMAKGMLSTGALSPTSPLATRSSETAAPGKSTASSSSYSNVPLPSTTNEPFITTRRRRAATVTTKTRSSKDFVTPPDPTTPAPANNTQPLSPSTETLSNGPPPAKPRKPRKRWTMEETQALVDGCNKWGVGNWKAILNDPQFEFQGRSPVDLKDRFRTYFPDAYRYHYPNAKTHLSSRVRSFLPDGTSIFEKTRSKKRRPFSAEEDEALRLGYEKHGTTWATIVKDPIFASQERRSTDLRDRFRNAFPELYKAAGYKPRPRASTSASRSGVTSSTASSTTSKATTEPRKGRRGRAGTMPTPISSSTSSVSVSERSASVRRRRTNSNAIGEKPIPPGEPTALDFYRPRNTTTISAASTPKVSPEDIPISDSDDDSDSELEYEEEEQYFPLKAIERDETSSGTTSPTRTEAVFVIPEIPEHKRELIKSEEGMDVDGDDLFAAPQEDDDLDGTKLLSPSGADTSSPVDSLHSTAPTSPTVDRSIQNLLEVAAAAAYATRPDTDFSESLFAVPRPSMQPHHSTASTTSLNTSIASEDWASISSQGGFGAGGLPSTSSATWLSNPASPSPSDYYQQPPTGGGGGGIRIGKSAWGPNDWLSNNPRLEQGSGGVSLTAWPTPASDQHAVLDRYDLYSTVEAAHDFASEADTRHNNYQNHHTHSYPDESIFRGFTHHRYAGDLIPGSGVAVHPPSLHSMGSGLSFGALGLGLAGMNGINGGGLQEDYAPSIGSTSHIGLAGIGALQDIDELSVAHHISSVTPSGAASPVKRPVEQELDLDAMIIVDHEPGTASEQVGQPPAQVGYDKIGMQLAIPSGQQSMEEAGAITPTTLNPASLPCPPSPLALGQARLPEYTQFRRQYPPPSRPHSRSVTTSHGPPAVGPMTPTTWKEASRSISQPPSEHRQMLQRSLSYLDPMTSTGQNNSILSSQFSDDPLAYNETLSISSLDLQYGMSAGPNIFTPLSMFSDQPSIAPLRTIHNAPSRNTPMPPPAPPASAPPTEEALELSALIHTSPIPPNRNHQRHQSQSMAASPGVNPRETQRRKRSSWDGGAFGMIQDDSIFLDFGRNQ